MISNAIHVLTTSKARLLTAAAAALCAFALAAAGAEAGSGGFGTGSDEAQKTKTKSGSNSGSNVKKAKYKRLWSKVTPRNKRWANRTAECESGHNPKAIGGGGRYRGAFQFMRATWKASPKSPGGDPVRFNYKTQAVVAVALKKRDGDGHWPACG